MVYDNSKTAEWNAIHEKKMSQRLAGNDTHIGRQNPANNPETAYQNRLAAMQGGASSVPVNNQGNIPITSSSLSNVTPLDLTAPNTAFNDGLTKSTMTAAGVSGSVGAKVDTGKSQLDEFLAQREKEKSQALQGTKGSLMESLGLKSKAIEDKAEALQSPETLAKQDAYNNAQTKKEQSERAEINEIDVINKSNMTDAGRAAALNTVRNKYALEQANLAVSLDVALRDYQSAISNIDVATQLKLDAIQPYIDYYSAAMTMDNANWSKAEQSIIDQKIKGYEQQQTDAKEVGEVMSTALQNGIDISALLPRLQKARNKAEALQIFAQAGISLQDPLDRQIKQAQLANLLDTGSSAPIVKTINGVDMQWNPTIQKWDSIGASVDNDKNASAQLQFLRDTAKTAKGLSNASGASGISKFIGDKLKGDSKFRQLEAQTNTLRTNVLTLVTDPSVKKYFGPQMSEADVRLMTAAGTTLNPENQSPAQLRTEIQRLDDLFARMQKAVNAGTAPTAKEGDTKDWQGVRYKVVNGQWVAQ